MTRDVLLRKWVEALESGKYTQTKGGLRRQDSYCCLGVLCDVSKVGGWESHSYDANQYVYATDSGSRGAYLPREIERAAGMARGGQGDLAEANDSGETFPQIAQRIRKMFPDVFPVAA